MKVTKDTVIDHVPVSKPKVIETLMSFGMGCVMCPASQTETLEEACLVHGMEVESLVDAINNLQEPEA